MFPFNPQLERCLQEQAAAGSNENLQPFGDSNEKHSFLSKQDLEWDFRPHNCDNHSSRQFLALSSGDKGRGFNFNLFCLLLNPTVCRQGLLQSRNMIFVTCTYKECVIYTYTHTHMYTFPPLYGSLFSMYFLHLYSANAVLVSSITLCFSLFTVVALISLPLLSNVTGLCAHYYQCPFASFSCQHLTGGYTLILLLIYFSCWGLTLWYWLFFFPDNILVAEHTRDLPLGPTRKNVPLGYNWRFSGIPLTAISGMLLADLPKPHLTWGVSGQEHCILFPLPSLPPMWKSESSAPAMTLSKP